MKTITLTLIVLLFFSSLEAQNESNSSETKYLFGSSDSKITGFGGFSSTFGQARGKFAHYSGGGGAVLFNYKYFVGGFGVGMSGESEFEDIYSEAGTVLRSNLSTSIGMGGLWMGYSFMHQNPIHFTASIKTGVGVISVHPDDFDHGNFYTVYDDYVGMVEPEIALEMNLLRWWRLQVGVGYRYVFDIANDTYFNAAGENKRYFKDNDFSTPTIGFSMLFGVFGPKH